MLHTGPAEGAQGAASSTYNWSLTLERYRSPVPRRMLCQICRLVYFAQTVHASGPLPNPGRRARSHRIAPPLRTLLLAPFSPDPALDVESRWVLLTVLRIRRPFPIFTPVGRPRGDKNTATPQSSRWPMPQIPSHFSLGPITRSPHKCRGWGNQAILLQITEYGLRPCVIPWPPAPSPKIDEVARAARGLVEEASVLGASAA
ncbi:hypothetical protein G7Z17_g13473 [Cylindrodendrum hubeiense]|uniref:Uncharacterized protein n=1 Tax=Cylindrodendrum hubeiense TaxID=595255 RepID=A0A9P5GTM0_9HYPO|nr:hypothetical protein G7Z17_g13473 [Cylindrodendrum hubeiense]